MADMYGAGVDMHLRVETVRGRHLVCGGILPSSAVKNGQVWAAADGSDRTVYVESAGEWVGYSWVEGGEKKLHTKMNFAFQCRYCLTVDTEELPDWLQVLTA